MARVKTNHNLLLILIVFVLLTIWMLLNKGQGFVATYNSCENDHLTHVHFAGVAAT